MSRQEDKLLPSGQVIPGDMLADTQTTPFSLQKLARKHTEDAFNVLLDLMQHAEEESVQLQAANAVLDRGWGKASVKIEATETKLDLAQLQENILKHQQYVDAKVAEARRVESEQLGQYIADDAEVVADPASHSLLALQSDGQGGGDSTLGLHTAPAPDPLPNASAFREAIYGAYGSSEAAPNHVDDVLQRSRVQDVLRYTRAEDAFINPQSEDL